ncbi:hypothetical protein [Bosea sp. RAC05]|uniref:hypothetical protein n=1 Tax=Bosea sp. RAC05 TaxID=1842539 RepID=UPI00083CFDDC|nr:hypothetical protein [Bosea sp. RAC05]AOG03108.1 hypothetical protein BSY19_4888 [Bosea sp. RAC05]
MRRSFADLVAGDRFITLQSSLSLLSKPQLTLWTLAEIASERRIAKDEAGADHAVEVTAYGSWFIRGTGDIVWTAPLPNGPAEAVKNYALALLSDRPNSILLHIDSVEGRRAQASLVMRSILAGGPDQLSPVEDEPEGTFTDIGGARFWSTSIAIQLPETWSGAAGDLIAAVNPDCRRDDVGVPVFDVVDPLSLGQGMSRLDVGAFMPNPELGMSSFLQRPAGPMWVLDCWELAYQRTLPNEALVLWYGEAGSSTSCSFLARTGSVFHGLDGVEDYFWRNDWPQGLYVLENAEGWSSRSHEGEVDFGIEGLWRPATQDDLARFGFSLDQVDHEAASIMDIEHRSGLAIDLIASAVPAEAILPRF